MIFVLILGLSLWKFKNSQVRPLDYSEFSAQVDKGNIESVRVTSVSLVQSMLEGKFKEPVSWKGKKTDRYKTDAFAFTPGYTQDLEKRGIKVSFAPPDKSILRDILIAILPIALIIGIFWFFFYHQIQSGGNKALSFGKSRAKRFGDSQHRITFKEVAGTDEAKEELEEIVHFLKNPHKFQKLGARIPKGVLLYGPPGCGKTLLARAIAGEAGVPFFSISGSDFVEMFGKKHAPCIIFIDEIDAVGRQRFAGIGGGHDEREQTLNQLLAEMDGFEINSGVILLAGTNRPDVLDKALLRPGRFDRQIEVYSPDINGREAILKLYVKKIVLNKDVDIKKLAQATPGFSGADLENMVNEAALLTARRDKKGVEMQEMEEAVERVVAGPERKSRIISEKEKNIIAYHESGHALLSFLIPEATPLHKVSIIPRGGHALGYTLNLPLEDKFLTSKKELLSEITVRLGGRTIEEIVFGEITTGAHNDLENATHLARRMVCDFGMSEKLGPITFRETPEKVFLGRDLAKQKSYSEQTAEEIDNEVKKIIENCYERAKTILNKNMDKIEKLIAALKEKEVLGVKEVEEILGVKAANGATGTKINEERGTTASLGRETKEEKKKKIKIKKKKKDDKIKDEEVFAS
jgi:cell division protease FtsH